MITDLASLLLAASITFLAAFGLLFFTLVTRNPADGALLAADRGGKRGNLFLAPIVVAVVLAPMPYRVFALAVGLALLIGLAIAQHKRLARVGASASFLCKLSAISTLVVFAGLCFGVASVLESYSPVHGS